MRKLNYSTWRPTLTLRHDQEKPIKRIVVERETTISALFVEMADRIIEEETKQAPAQ